MDTGSADTTREDLVGALGEAAVHVAARATGFGAAVTQALDGVPHAVAGPAARPGTGAPAEWLWLLHDDAAPDPEALAALLDQAARDPGAGVIGPKVRAWPASRRLREAGVTISRSGRRERGVDPAERDQGQHDTVHEVLAVNTAGMLVRRDLFEAVGGIDPQIVLFDDDIDLCWRIATLGYRTVICPKAVLYHAEAATDGRRPVHASRRTRGRLARGNAIYLLAANASPAVLPVVVVRLVLASLLRCLGLLVAKAPTAAGQEFLGLVDALGRPRRLAAGRRARAAAHRSASHGAPVRVGPLLARRSDALRRAAAAVGELVATAGTEGSTVAGGGRHRTTDPTARRSAPALETGPVDESAENLESVEGTWWRRLRHPFAITALVLLVVAAIATGALWSSQISGAALWPAPAGAGDLWDAAVRPWHAVELGSSRVAPPWLAVMATLSSLAAGKPWIAVAVVLLGSVPLAGISGYLAARSLIRSTRLRIWAGVSYGLLPAATGAVAQGRLGTALVLVLAPLLLLAIRRGLTGGRSVRGSWPAVFTSGLLLAVCSAFVPATWLVVVVAGVLGAVLARSFRWLFRIVMIAATAFVLTLPWSATLLTEPFSTGWGRWFAEPGYPWIAPTAGSSRWSWWIQPLGEGSVPLYTAALLLLAGLVALTRTDRARPVLVAWLLVAVSGVLAVTASAATVSTPTGGTARAWPGSELALVLAALIAAAAIGADGAFGRLRRHSFGWRQRATVALSILTALLPVGAALWWLVRGADDPVLAQPRAVVPAYIAAQQGTPVGARTLLVRPSPTDPATGTWQLLRDDAMTSADVAVAAGPVRSAPVDGALRAVLVDQSLAATNRVAQLGVRYLYLTDGSGPLAQQLDTTPGLVRGSAPEGAAVWALQQPTGPMRIDANLLRRGGPNGMVIPPTVLAADPRDATVPLPAGPSGRRLQLAESADPRWRAAVAGTELAPVEDGGLQTFELPESRPGAELTVRFVDPPHTRWTWLQLGALVVVALLAFPGIARDSERAARADRAQVRR